MKTTRSTGALLRLVWEITMIKFVRILPAALALAGLPACTPTGAAQATPLVPSAPSPGIDLGSSGAGAPSSSGEGHERAAPGGHPYLPVHEGHEDAQATGIVSAVDAVQHKLTISHDPIPEIGWPAMTMEFPVASSVDITAVKPGSRIRFTLEKAANGMYRIEALQPGAGQ